uniref:RNA 3'-terminal phosphate cyclase n=1 Tax=Fervidicoccus fontis TaxID=683846 RepID=A0A7J3ZLH6_9CREN
MKVIDGSMGEGGGQILRTTLALSAVTGMPVRIVNVRAKRKNPGLQRQHLTGVKAVAALSNARVRGAELGSTILEFEPRGLRGGTFRFDIGTAGSVTLVLQAVLPILPFLPEPVEITVTGGTDVPWSPTIDYVRGVLVRILEKLGFNLQVVLHRRGHYPRGGGIVEYKVDDPPRKLKPVELVDRGGILRVAGISHSIKLPQHVAERQASSAMRVIKSRLGGIDIDIRVESDPQGENALGPGSGIAVWAEFEGSILGADSLGARGKRAEVVGEEAAAKLVEDVETGAALDRHMSDMIIPLLALASGKSTVSCARLTLHAQTNIMVVGRMLESAIIRVEGEPEQPFKLEVKGIGSEL